MPAEVVISFFFQAEDGIRDVAVTGVQTCALPISPERYAAGKIRFVRELEALRPAQRRATLCGNSSYLRDCEPKNCILFSQSTGNVQPTSRRRNASPAKWHGLNVLRPMGPQLFGFNGDMWQAPLLLGRMYARADRIQP